MIKLMNCDCLELMKYIPVGIELDENYFNIAEQRIKEAEEKNGTI